MNKAFPFQKRVLPDEEKPTKQDKVVEEVVKEKITPVVQEVKKPKTVVVKKETREKYTAMMDKELRIRIKIASVRRGIDVSKYIEEAVLAKLEREGE